MAKTSTRGNGSLKSKLQALLNEEEKRHEQRKAKLVEKRDTLRGQLQEVEKELKDMEKEFNRHIQQSLKEAGIPLPKKSQKPSRKSAQPRGTNQQWICDQLKSGPKTRKELIDRAESDNVNANSVSQAIYEMSKNGKLTKTGKGRKATYKLP